MAVPNTGKAHLRAHSHPGARPSAFLEVALALTRTREMYATRMRVYRTLAGTFVGSGSAKNASLTRVRTRGGRSDFATFA